MLNNGYWDVGREILSTCLVPDLETLNQDVQRRYLVQLPASRSARRPFWRSTVWGGPGNDRLIIINGCDMGGKYT
jgi:hypothetical protein